MQDLPSNSQGASQGSLMDTKVLKTLAHGLEGAGELVTTVGPSQPLGGGAFQFSRAFTYFARLGDTKTATVYLAKGSDGEFAIKVRAQRLVMEAY
jgi:hypothetical protein